MDGPAHGAQLPLLMLALLLGTGVSANKCCATPKPCDPALYYGFLAHPRHILFEDYIIPARDRFNDFGPCYRECSPFEPPRVCEFIFVEELYPTCNSACRNCTQGVKHHCLLPDCVCPDGHEKTVITINRELPTQPINVCQHDIVKVTLFNKVQGRDESIHWHGMLQHCTPWMDGVAMVTQCPIAFGQKFTYLFSATDFGTHFFHPHSGINKADGGHGALIVRPPKSLDPSRRYYDVDIAQHVIVFTDYLRVTADSMFPGDRTEVIGQPNSNAFFNGFGKFNGSLTPLAEFVVTSGLRFRFRLIGALNLVCPIGIYIVGHSFLIIAVDGHPIRPKRVDLALIYAGERLDIVVNAIYPPGSLFYIYASTAYAVCSRNGGVSQLAVLRYGRRPGAGLARTLPRATPPSIANPPNARRVFNHPTNACEGNLDDEDGAGTLCAAQLESLGSPYEEPLPFVLADFAVPIALNFYVHSDEELFQSGTFHKFAAFGDTELSGTLNKISFLLPPSPGLTQYEEALPHFCNDQLLPKKPGCNFTHCQCTHMQPIPLNKRVAIIIVDTTTLPANSSGDTSLSHPIHMHGHKYRVMHQGIVPNIQDGDDRMRYVVQDYRLGRLPYRSRNPPYKDTVLLPAGGYVVILICTDNPGFWFFHCHFDFHMATGMEAIFKEGEPKDFKKAPYKFPTCGDYIL